MRKLQAMQEIAWDLNQPDGVAHDGALLPAKLRRFSIAAQNVDCSHQICMPGRIDFRTSLLAHTPLHHRCRPCQGIRQ